MTVKDFYKIIEKLVLEDRKLEAFNISISNETIYSVNEMIEFFQLNRKKHSIKWLGLSGSGGSGIKKPNITTIVAHHVSRIIAKSSDDIVIKFGSRKRTSAMGSIDFGEKINNKYFILKNDEIFNEVLKYLLFNESIKKFIDSYYLSSVPIDKKVVFVKNIDEMNQILEKNLSNLDIKIIFSKLGGNDIDEIIANEYYTYEAKTGLIKKSNEKYIDIENYQNVDLNILNEQLLLGNFSNKYWGESVRISMIEVLSFFLDISYSDAEQIVLNYISNIKTLVVFDLDGTILNQQGNIDEQVISRLQALSQYIDIAGSTGATLQAAISKTKKVGLKSIMANYGSSLIQNGKLEEFTFDKNMVMKILNNFNYNDYIMINSFGVTNDLSCVQKLVLYTNDFSQFQNNIKELCYFYYDGYVEIVPYDAKARAIRFLKNKFSYNNIITIGNDENDYEMFSISDISYSINYNPKLNNHIIYSCNDDYNKNINFIIDQIILQIGGQLNV